MPAARYDGQSLGDFMGNALEEFISKLRNSDKKHEIDLAEMFPPEKIERIMKKEVRRYREALNKKWENWLDAVRR